MNIQVDHVHLLVVVPPKVSVSGFGRRETGRARRGAYVDELPAFRPNCFYPGPEMGLTNTWFDWKLYGY